MPTFLQNIGLAGTGFIGLIILYFLSRMLGEIYDIFIKQRFIKFLMLHTNAVKLVRRMRKEICHLRDKKW